jgi:hypothetical protein
VLVDHERLLLRLKEYIAGREGHGSRTLLAEISRLETECQVEEGLPEKAFRLYGVALAHDLITSGTESAPQSPQASAGEDDGTALPRANRTKEEHDAGHRDRAAAAV